MTVHLYATVLSAGVMLLTLYALGALAAFFFSPTIRAKILALPYDIYLKSIGLIAGISTLGVLIFQFIYDTKVCELCWWQRIGMFPIEIIALVTLLSVSREQIAHRSIAILALFGGSIAAWHYYEHVRSFVFGLVSNLPCSAVGLTPACSESPILVFGFMTIPGMALCAFTTILVLCFFAEKVRSVPDTKR
jgi:disulfide bond formation protein DsbB